MDLMTTIRNFDESGNTAFHLMRGSSQIAALTIRWEDKQTIRNLLEVPDDLHLYMDSLDNPSDPRKFIVLMNPMYSRPFPMVLIFKYEQDGKDKVLVDVGREDLDFVRFVQSEYLSLSRNYREVTLTLKDEKEPYRSKVLSAIAEACMKGGVLEKNLDLSYKLTVMALQEEEEEKQEGEETDVGKQPEESGETEADELKEISLVVSADYAKEENILIPYLGFFCEKGIYFEQDYDTAVKLYELAAASGNAQAKNDRAWMIQNGFGVEEDIPLAVRLYEQAAEEGCSDACVNLGNIYEFGLLGKPDYDLCFKWYQQAAKAGNTKGRYNVANCYHWGYGVKQDYEKAYSLFKELADEDAEDSVWFYMGYYSEEGLGGAEQNYGKALRYYHKGARAGDAYCYNQIAVMYGRGLGVKKNNKTALKYYKQAADLGDALALTNIGYLYENGDLGEPDPDRALSYYLRAAGAGDEEGEKAYVRLSKELRKSARGSSKG